MVFFLYWCYIASLLCYSYVCLYYHACLHYVNKKWSDKDTDCTCCVYCILNIVEITIISAFHGYMTCPTFFFFWVFVSDDFTLSPLGVPPALRNKYAICNEVQCFYHWLIWLIFKHWKCKLTLLWKLADSAFSEMLDSDKPTCSRTFIFSCIMGLQYNIQHKTEKGKTVASRT